MKESGVESAVSVGVLAGASSHRGRLVFVWAVVSAIFCAPGSIAAASVVEPTDAGPEVAQRLDEAKDLLEEPVGPPLPLPPQPQQALAISVRNFASFLKVQMDDPAPAIAAAHLTDDFAGRASLTLSALHQCAVATDQAVKGLGLNRIAAALRGQQSLDRAVGAGIRACAGPALRTLRDLERDLPPGLTDPVSGCGSGKDDLDLWPVLRVDTNEDSCYAHDYILIIDSSGDDTYDNNAGSNLVDLLRRPPLKETVEEESVEDEDADDAPRVATKARGCRHAIPGLAAADCTPVAAIVLDTKGDDRYGVKEDPKGDLLPTVVGSTFFEGPDFTDRPGDAHCTSESKSVVARMMTQGAGFLGLGVLRDASGYDVYTGKTGSQGTGHVFGIGILSDGGGEDVYTAVRNSQGFALVGGIGILMDKGADDDSYDFYMPPPKIDSSSTEEKVFKPSAAQDSDLKTEMDLNTKAGIGGVIDDIEACDRVSRFLQGAGNVSALGVLVDEGGDDTYVGGNEENSGGPGLPFKETSSQGYGNNAAVGVLADRAGTDDYVVRTFDPESTFDPEEEEEPGPEEKPMPHRANDHVHLECAEGTAFGLFVDSPSDKSTRSSSEKCPVA